jgi:acetylornithine deacetylase/succinyl-diaminopimelate desuccinylase-like protein
VAELRADWLDEVSELLRIPSISADAERKEDVRRAAEWVAEFVRRMGGEAELVETPTFPLAVGEVRASSDADGAPTVLCYGHFDVQRRSMSGRVSRLRRRSGTGGSTAAAPPTTRASSGRC